MTEGISRKKVVLPSCQRLNKYNEKGKGIGKEMDRNVRISLIPGSLVDRRVDVLVNSTNANLDLDKGAVSKAILKVAGKQLKTECRIRYPGKLELGDVVDTGAYDLQPVRAVYHTVLQTYAGGLDDRIFAEDVLRFSVTRCLKKAIEANLSSIAFPTLGIGNNGFPVKTAAKNMMGAIQLFLNANPNSSLRTVEIVVFEASTSGIKIWKEFQDELQNIIPIEEEDLNTFQAQIASPSLEVPQNYSSLWERKIKKQFDNMYEQDIRVPQYWTSVTGGELVRLCVSQGTKDFQLVDVDGGTEHVIAELILKTWEKEKVGQGRDASGLGSLGYRSLKITKIQRIENLQLYKAYAEGRQNLIAKGRRNARPFISIGKTQYSSKEVETEKILNELKYNPLGKKFLSDTLPDINEHYLFHATTGRNIENVLSQGLDNRLATGESMFGAGIYAAESSTKADQYADNRDRRTKRGLKMFLLRVTLGDALVCRYSQLFRRGPCRACLKDRCNCKGTQHYDSVLGDGSWIFREFVVYDKRQVYPEYLISYERI